MMCEATCSESGQLLTIKPCGWYLALQSDRDRLAGVVAGMEDQNARNLDALRWAEAENARLRVGDAGCVGGRVSVVPGVGGGC